MQISMLIPSLSGIIYCFSRKDCEQVCMDLCKEGIRAGYYHADLLFSDRSRVHRQWLNNELQVPVIINSFFGCTQ